MWLRNKIFHLWKNKLMKEEFFLKLWAHHIMLAPNSLVYSQIRLFLKYPKIKPIGESFGHHLSSGETFFAVFSRLFNLPIWSFPLPLPIPPPIAQKKVSPLPSFENGPCLRKRSGISLGQWLTWLKERTKTSDNSGGERSENLTWNPLPPFSTARSEKGGVQFWPECFSAFPSWQPGSQLPKCKSWGRGFVGPGGGHPGKRTAGACLLDQGSGKSLQNLRRKKENPRILEEAYAMTEWHDIPWMLDVGAALIFGKLLVPSFGQNFKYFTWKFKILAIFCSLRNILFLIPSLSHPYDFFAGPKVEPPAWEPLFPPTPTYVFESDRGIFIVSDTWRAAGKQENQYICALRYVENILRLVPLAPGDPCLPPAVGVECPAPSPQYARQMLFKAELRKPCRKSCIQMQNECGKDTKSALIFLLNILLFPTKFCA